MLITRRPARSRAAGAVVLAALALSAAACAPSQPTRDAQSGEITEAVDDADVFALRVGDCLGDSPEGDVASVPTVPCDEPHTDEIYLSTELPDGDFPDEEAFIAHAEEECMPAFAEFVGLAYEDSVLELTTMEPTEESWADGDREVLCLVYDPAGEVTGSLEGARR